MMQIAMDFEDRGERETATGVACPVERVVSQPWLRPDKPWWWRQRQLQNAADDVAATLVIYRSGEYGPSLLLARAARDEFYLTHEKAALEAAG